MPSIRHRASKFSAYYNECHSKYNRKIITLNAIAVYSIMNKSVVCMKWFLFYNATYAVVEHLFIAVETDWLTKQSMLDCYCLNRIKLVNSCVGR